MKAVAMKYLERAHEDEESAEKLNRVIQRLLRERTGKGKTERKELSDRIAYYKRIRNECLNISNHLTERHLGVG